MKWDGEIRGVGGNACRLFFQCEIFRDVIQIEFDTGIFFHVEKQCRNFLPTSDKQSEGGI